tara:strand:- start:116 stop:292 length:177 start_codon:yes stop_codon:yes gene_type:complete
MYSNIKKMDFQNEFMKINDIQQFVVSMLNRILKVVDDLTYKINNITLRVMRLEEKIKN